jgi:hypothetical protein
LAYDEVLQMYVFCNDEGSVAPIVAGAHMELYDPRKDTWVSTVVGYSPTKQQYYVTGAKELFSPGRRMRMNKSTSIFTSP